MLTLLCITAGMAAGCSAVVDGRFVFLLLSFGSTWAGTAVQQADSHVPIVTAEGTQQGRRHQSWSLSRSLDLSRPQELPPHQTCIQRLL